MMKPSNLIQLDWHTTQEASKIFQPLLQPGTLKLKQFGLLEKPSVGLQLDEVNYKLFVSGKGGVGKTSLISRLSGNDIPVTYCETSGIQVTVIYWPVKLVQTSRVVIFRLEFWDAGEVALKKFDHVLPACKEDVDAVLFVFSFTERTSFEEIPQQISNIIQPSERPCPIVIGTRYDQHLLCEVSQRDVQMFEQHKKIPVIKMKNFSQDNSSKSMQKSEFNEMGYALNIICNQLWKRDQTLAGISLT